MAKPENTKTRARRDVQQEITNKIIEALEDCLQEGRQPWRDTNSIDTPLRFNGEPYRGINRLVLWHTATLKNYASPFWMTYRQAEELGGQVRAGEKSTLVVFANKVSKTNSRKESEEPEYFFLWKGYNVFNATQIDNLPEKYTHQDHNQNNKDSRLPEIETFFGNTGARVVNGGNRALYSPSTDTIHMPAFEAFDSAYEYYAVLAHEHIHWTAHEERLNRNLRTRFGDESYAMEELVAEIGAAFICSDIGIQTQIEEDHASYISSWIKVLREDKKAIVTAARKAQDAADFLNKSQPEELAEAA